MEENTKKDSKKQLHNLHVTKSIYQKGNIMYKLMRTLMASALAVILAFTISFSSIAAPNDTIRVSVGVNDLEGNGSSGGYSISANGRYIAFASNATNLVPEDTNGVEDVVVRDVFSNITTRISVASDGTQANGASGENWGIDISEDGRYVAFESLATNLVPDDTNEQKDIFLRDTISGETTRVSLATDGTQGNDWSNYPSVSGDGRYVAFTSVATNLVPNDWNNSADVFVYDTQNKTLLRASVSTDGAQGNAWSYSPSISADGRYVTFGSFASNLVPNDPNWRPDIFLHDNQTGETSRVSEDSSGIGGDASSFNAPSISMDGRYIAFESSATNLVDNDTNNQSDIFVHDNWTGINILVSVASDGTQGNDGSIRASISPDGNCVTFTSFATNLVPGDVNAIRDVFMHDLRTGTTILISQASDGTQANSSSEYSGISNSGLYVVFISTATNLVSGDINELNDVFLRETGVFLDVPVGHWAKNFIEKLYLSKISSGCGNGNFCPNQFVTRAQMAVFVLRAKYGTSYTPPAATGTMFLDVPSNYWAAPWIEALANEGVTGGCANGNYCPEVAVTRDQMAVLLLRSVHGNTYQPPAASGTMFGDVAGNYWAAAWIEALATEGITGGCGNGDFCPRTPVNRAQMAVFLTTAFNIP